MWSEWDTDLFNNINVLPQGNWLNKVNVVHVKCHCPLVDVSKASCFGLFDYLIHHNFCHVTNFCFLNITQIHQMLSSQQSLTVRLKYLWQRRKLKKKHGNKGGGQMGYGQKLMEQRLYQLRPRMLHLCNHTAGRLGSWPLSHHAFSWKNVFWYLLLK